jgi:hypothetical protein
VYTHVRCGCIHEDTLFPSWWIQLFSEWMKHLWMDSWLYFPGLKVGKNETFILPFWLLGCFDFLSYETRTVFSFVVFCYLSQG